MGIHRPALLLALALLSGCTYSFAMVDAKEAKGKTVEVSNSFFFWGLGGSGMVDVAAACHGGRFYKILDIPSGWTLVAQFFTLGIYSPRTVEITCAKA